jgi:glyoxylase-like metal-dependent hydrolase (beta-lactamase superfamily II)
MFADTYDIYGSFKVSVFVTGEKWRQNCYLLTEGRNAVLIDPGYDVEKRVIEEIEENSYLLQHLLVTHAHHDHLAGAQKLSEYFSLPLTVHSADKRVLMHAPMYSSAFAGKSLQRPGNIRWLDEKTARELADWGIDLLHTPGHTKGGISIFYRQSVFSGDTLFRHYLGRTDLPEGSRDQLLKSVESFFARAVEKGVLYIYPGHGDKWRLKEALDWWSKKDYRELKEF